MVYEMSVFFRETWSVQLLNEGTPGVLIYMDERRSSLSSNVRTRQSTRPRRDGDTYVQTLLQQDLALQHVSDVPEMHMIRLEITPFDQCSAREEMTCALGGWRNLPPSTRDEMHSRLAAHYEDVAMKEDEGRGEINSA